MHSTPLFVTGIGTSIGKTIVSAILVEKLKADYWKPVQSGDLDDSDTEKLKSLVANRQSVFHPEAYRLTLPYSPHKSAALDGIVIDEAKFVLPPTSNQLLIEGAGGLMVPLNDHFFIIDLITQLKADVILVAKNYLGSINHTLLSINALQQRSINVKGIIFNGATDDYSEEIILSYTGIRLLGRIPQLQVINPAQVTAMGNLIDL